MQIRLIRFFLISPFVWLAAACATVPPAGLASNKAPQLAAGPTGGNEASPVERGAPVETAISQVRLVQAEEKPGLWRTGDAARRPFGFLLSAAERVRPDGSNLASAP